MWSVEDVKELRRMYPRKPEGPFYVHLAAWIKERDYDLKARNPNKEIVISYPKPEELVKSILEKEKHILKVLEDFRDILGEDHG